MAEIKLKSLRLENFGNTKDRTVTTGSRTRIIGRNEAGKTTLGDAYSWLLTDKLMNGSQADGIRPKENGKDIDFVDISVTAEMEIDGRVVKVQKIQSQNWVKKTGKFTGNVNTYFVNDIPKKEKEFKEFLFDILGGSGVEYCTNASAFLKLDSKKRRQLLFSLVPNFSDDDVIVANPEFESIRQLLWDGSVEELISRAKYRLSGRGRGDRGLKGQLEDIPTRIDEASKQIADVAEYELAINEISKKIAELDEEEAAVDDVAKSYDSAMMKIAELHKKRDSIVQEAKRSAYAELDAVRSEIFSLSSEKRTLESETSAYQTSIERYKLKVAGQEARRKELLEKWQAESAREFDKSRLVCSYCGQALPEDKQADALAQFENGKECRLADIEAEGNEVAESIKQLKKSSLECAEKLSVCTAKIKEITEKAVAMNSGLEAQSKPIDLTQNEEYNAIVAEIEQAEAALANIDNSAEKRRDIRIKRSQLTSDKSMYAQKISGSQKAQERVEELKTQQREIAQKIADCEKELDLLKRFNQAKCTMLTNEVNKLFRFTKWDLFDWNIDGEGYKEICEPVYQGIRYGQRLNGGARVLVDADLCATFQRMNGVNVPIWLDNAESLSGKTRGFLDEFEQQLIFLEVAECDLTVM